MMNELELGRLFWKRKLREVKLGLEIEEQKAMREVGKLASRVADVVVQSPEQEGTKGG